MKTKIETLALAEEALEDLRAQLGTIAVRAARGEKSKTRSKSLCEARIVAEEIGELVRLIGRVETFAELEGAGN